MGLRDADLKRLYFLDSHHPYEFYEQLYLNSEEIYTALGYFSGSAFSIGAEGLIAFLQSNGRMKFVCNDKLYAPDVDAIASGYEVRERGGIELQDVVKLIEAADKYAAFGFTCLSYLIAADRLDIKVIQSDKLVHYKIGYARDNTGECVAFDGSVNYTLSGLMLNDEQLHVTCGWRSRDDAELVADIKKKLDSLWQEEQPGYSYVRGSDIRSLISKKFPPRPISELHQEFELVKQAMLRNLGSIRRTSEYRKATFFTFPDEVRPRDYQLEAIQNWEKHNYQSVFAMATGTGKTLTALFAINALFFIQRSLRTVLIIVPLKDLVDQWMGDINDVFDGTVITVRGGTNWSERLRTHRLTTVTKPQPAVVISTYNSFSRHYDKLTQLLELKDCVIVADEVHRFGAESLRHKLPETIQHRIGLSATPKREYDEEGTAAIFDYFCPHDEPFEVSIRYAIELGVLCRYYYHCVFVELTEDELGEYVRLSDRLRNLYLHNTEAERKSKRVREETTRVLKERHRIIEQARNKFDAFLNVIQELQSQGGDLKNAVVYVPEGTQDDDSVIDMYTRALYGQFGILVSKYVQGAKKTVLNDFKKGRIQMVAAKKRLDEGVNIPAIETAFFVASSTVEREFVQRRGRILRKSPGKKYARIYDFLVVPPRGYDLQMRDADVNSLINGELKRALLFAENAINRFEATREIEKQYL